MVSCAKENRNVVVMDIPGAFLHVDLEGIPYMILEGEILELIIKLELDKDKKLVW